MNFNDGANWRASLLIHGSPGRSDEIIDDIKDLAVSTPTHYFLYQNYPNPFNPVTTIRYDVGAYGNTPVQVDLSIHNILGQKVATLVDKKQAAGRYQVQWDAGQLASGIYFYKLQMDSYISIKKMVFVK